MEIFKVTDFYSFLHDYTNTLENYIFRGMRNSTWGLIPSVGRIRKKDGTQLRKNDEEVILKVFKHRAYPFVKEYLDSNIELLTIGQHHGLPTRALDWTKNPLIAMYFAVEEPFSKTDLNETDFSVVFIHEPINKIILDSGIEPFEITEVTRYIPKHWDQRISSQSGLFTVHNEPYVNWKPSNLLKIKIHHKIRKDIKVILNELGVNPGTVYPDLDGISRHIRWLRSDEH